MSQLSPYLLFNGNCHEAMKFYESCFGGELFEMTYEKAQGKDTPAALKDKIIHAALKKGDFLLMASDAHTESPVDVGNNVQVYVNCKSLDEVETLFKSISRKGEINLPMEDTFWNSRFGMVKDQFGINWMLSFDKTQKK
jgi:PhnB protein